MLLEKFYLDVVADDGSGCIAYAARLAGVGLRSTVAATLVWPSSPEGAVIQRRTLRGSLPEIRSQGLDWSCAGLNAKGSWHGVVSQQEHILYERGTGLVSWAPLLPSVPTSVHVGDREFTGRGYAERLTVSILPWQLPIRTLRWGRFAGRKHHVIWIDWQHSTPRRWLWHDGVQQLPTEITQDRIAWGSWALAIERGRLLRAGRLADTVLSRWPALRRLLPKQLQALNEAKHCSRCALTGPDGQADEGWAIHEQVEFP